jgi:hypothetical protein
MRLAVLGLAGALAGCVLLLDAPLQLVNTTRITNSTMVTWELVDDIDAQCRKLGIASEPNSTFYGCVEFTTTQCKIYTARVTTEQILGHELRHCFEGLWHP